MRSADGLREEHHGVGAWMRANLTTQGYCLTDVVTATNLCLPSEMFAWLARRRTPATTPITY